MKITTAQEMRDIDRRSSERYGVPSLTLMENAGTAVAEFIQSHFPRASRIVILCGKGNNGGDGFVIARKLHVAGRVVEVLLLASPGELRGDAAEMFARLPVSPVLIKSEEAIAREGQRSLAHAELIVDALLGTGFRPPVTPLYAAAIRAINRATAPIVAVDIPSGADADHRDPQRGEAIARANAVVTFTALRPAHVFGALTHGVIALAQIGSPPEAVQTELGFQVITPNDFAPFIADREQDGHKGTYGHALLIAGSYGKSGAAALAGMAALRSGAGLVTVATPRSVLTAVASFAPEMMTEPLPETSSGAVSSGALKNCEALAKGKAAVAIGPGLSQEPETVKLVQDLVSRIECPVIIDADALNAIALRPELLKRTKVPVVITPHPGEMSRLAGKSTKEVQADRIGTARAFAGKYGVTVVLKGHRTVIASPQGQTWINCTGNPGMASGGTGDALTGILAGAIAQHPRDLLTSVLASVYLHGLAGDVAREHVGEIPLLATDIIHLLPEAIRRARGGRHHQFILFNG